MKTFKFKFLALLVAVGTITACSLGDDSEPYCFTLGYVATIAATGPETTTVNVPITIDVTFSVANSCGTFTRFAESPGFPKTVVAAVDFRGCECTPVTTPTTKPYTFTSATAGTYVLNFTTGNQNAPIVKTIVVTQ